MNDIKLIDENSRISFSPKERMLQRLSKSPLAAIVTSWAQQELERGEHPADVIEALACGMVSVHASIAAMAITEPATNWPDLAEIIASDFKLTLDGMYATLFLQGKGYEDSPHST